jgi:hypothetical protein
MIHNFRVASMQEDDRKNALKALDADIKRLMNEGGADAIDAEPRFRMKMAKLLRDAVQDEVNVTDLTPILTDRRNGGQLGDTHEVEIKHNTLRVVQYAPQSMPLVFSPTKSKYSVKTEMFELAWGIELFKIMTGQHTTAEFAAYAAEAVTRHYQKFTLEALDAAITGNDPRGRPVRTAAAANDIAKAELDLALRRMGTNVTIYGSRYALSPIFEFGAQSGGEALKDEFARRGVIGSYRGARLAAVEPDFHVYTQKWTQINGKDWEKLIFIVDGNEKPAVFFERDLNALQWSELDTKEAVFGAGIRMDHGIFVDKPYRGHIIQLLGA